MLSFIKVVDVGNNDIQIVCHPIPTIKVTIYYGFTPSVDIDDKTKLGSFEPNAIIFREPTYFNKRIYYVCIIHTEIYVVSKRNITLDGTFNTRDFGGYINNEGKMVKLGILYRSDALNKISENDKEILENLNIKTIVDLRTQQEIERAPDLLFRNVRYVSLTSNNNVVAQLASGSVASDQAKVEKLVLLASSDEGKRQLELRYNDMEKQMRKLVSNEQSIQMYRKYIELLKIPDNTPILHHCMGGKDRAGLVSTLVLLILGVNSTFIYEDYLLTKELMKERNIKRMNEYRQYTDNSYVLTYLSKLMQTNSQYLDAAFDEILKLSNSTSNYLHDYLALSNEDIKKLKDLYLY